MANRRPMDSSQHHASPMRDTHLQHYKTLLLTLASVLLLSSINCASFGHRSVNQPHQQQYNIPDYQVYSGGPKDEAYLDDNLNYQPYTGKQPALEQLNLDELELLPENSYFASPAISKDQLFTSSSSSSSSSGEQDFDQLYKQLLLARHLLKDQLASPPAQSSSSSLLSSDDYPAINSADSSSSSSFNNYNNDDLSDYNAKLDEQLLRDEKKLFSLGSQNYDFKYDNPKNPLYFLPDQSSYNDDQINDKITLSLQQDEKDDPAATGRAKVTYNLSIEDDDDESPEIQNNKLQMGTNDDGSSLAKNNDQRNLTTLLEDEAPTTEEPRENGEANGNSTAGPATSTGARTITTPEPTVSQASYGTIVTGARPEGSMSSIFNRLYDKLASYLPNFINFSSKKSTSDTSKGIVTHTNDRNNTTSSNPDAILKSISSSDNDGNGHDNSTNENDNNKKPVKDIKQVTASSKTDSKSQADSDVALSSSASSTLMGTSDTSTNNEDLENAKMGVWNMKVVSNVDNDSSVVKSNEASKRLVTSSASLSNVDDEIKESRPTSGGHRVNLLRQSTLVLPLKSSGDELIIQPDGVTHPASLLGKYIYAPEHHYHLNTQVPLNSKRDDIDDERQMYTQMSQRSYMRHLRPGDSVFSSYSGFNPLYDPQAHQGLSGNKTNDVYFLAMVGSFCAMAMAVVLAAGLFAYRVQQNRKSSSDTDYPTYGVVGPNSMNGKCGAASFVGGYFGSAGGPGSSSACGSSKAGSVKQLADLYCGDNGVASGNGAGSNKTSKKALNEQNNSANHNNNFMANQNAARMYHYQHQKQQMIISGQNSAGGHASASDLDSEDENDDGTYTVYECPGLASAHEMEIKNPLFNDDQSP